MTWRPSSLSEVARRSAGGEDFDSLVREFVDELGKMADQDLAQALSEEPQGPWSGTSQKPFLAAMAEHYARQRGVKVPDWTEKPECFLDRAVFGTTLQGLRAHLIIASPPAFRRRLIFVDRDPIPRAPRPVDFTPQAKPMVSGSVSIRREKAANPNARPKV